LVLRQKYKLLLTGIIITLILGIYIAKSSYEIFAYSDLTVNSYSIDNTQISSETELYSSTAATEAAINKEITGLTNKINIAEKEYKEKLGLFKKRIIIMYRMTNGMYSDTFLNSKDMFDFYQKVDIMNKVAKSDSQMLFDLSLSKKEVEFTRQMLKKLKDGGDIDVNSDSLVVSADDIKDDVENRENALALLKATELEFDEVSKGMPKKVGTLVDHDSEFVGGAMIWPVPSSNDISSPYGWRIHPIYGYKKFHTGIDVAASYKARIVAANGGTVVYTGWEDSYGRKVIIDHGGKIATLYAHTSAVVVTVGEKVESGQLIAYVGSTGASTGNHLHFEVIIADANGNFGNINPLKYVTAN
jgi:murein DD-endopeptidase MepM/ murein hydrolase activator NlpD